MATPTTVQEQELDKLLNPAEAGSIEQTIKVHPNAAALDPNKTQGRHHRTLLAAMLERTKAWVKALYEAQNYSGPYRAGIVSAGDVHYTKTTTELTLWRALADFTADAAPSTGAQWEQFAVVPVTLTEQDLTDIEQRLTDLETAMQSDDLSLDTIQKIVNYIKDNRSSLQQLGGVLNSLIEFADELDLRLLEMEQAIILLQQVVASDDPMLDTIQKIVNYIKSTTPGTTGSVGSIPTWVIAPIVKVEDNLDITVKNVLPNLPTADWNDRNIVFPTKIIASPNPVVDGTLLYAPPADGIHRTDAIDASPNGYYEYSVGQESTQAGAAPALLNNRLRAAYIIWVGSTGTVTYPEGNGYWGGMQYSSTNSMTIEEYFLSLMPTVQPSKLLGRGSDGGAGPMEEIMPGAGMYVEGTSLNMGFLNKGDTIYGGMPFPANSSVRFATTHTGYLRIQVPFTTPGYIVFIKGTIRELSSYELRDQPEHPLYNKITTFQIGGSCAKEGNTVGVPTGWWGDTNAIFITENPARDLPVRFVFDEAEGKGFIYLGEATTQWSGMMVVVEEVIFANQVGGSAVIMEEARRDWIVSHQAAITGTVYQTETDNLPLAKGFVTSTPGEGDGSFTPITLNQYGSHPAFTTQHELNVWLLKSTQNATF